MRALLAPLLALAAASATLAGVGTVVADHAEGSAGRAHEHPVSAYRFPILLFWDTPGVPEAEELAHHVRSAHAEHLRALLGSFGASAGPVHPLAELAAGTILALLVVAAPRLPRPTRRAVATVAIPRIAPVQWRSGVATPPPRLPVFATP